MFSPGWSLELHFTIKLCFISEINVFVLQDDSRISVQLITEECVHKLDSKHQTNALLNLVWRDSASEEVFTMMASICHTLMVQHRLMVPKVRYKQITDWKFFFRQNVSIVTAILDEAGTIKPRTTAQVSLLFRFLAYKYLVQAS